MMQIKRRNCRQVYHIDERIISYVRCITTHGNVIVVAIAEDIVKRLGINGDSTYVQQEITDDGILLRPVKQYLKEWEM